MLPLDPHPGGLPRRVLMTADAVGGVWTYALDLAQGLAARGVQTVLAVLGPAPDAAQRAAAAPVPGLVLRETGQPLDWTAATPEALAAAARAIAALARAEGAGLVQLNSPVLAALARFDAPVIGLCHSCVATWWRAVRGPAQPLPAEFAWRTAVLGEAYARADALVAPSAAFARATAEAYGLPRPPLVVHNGRAVPRARAVPAEEPIVLTAGRLWDEGKNLAALDAAAARLAVPVLAAGPLRGPNGATVALRHARALGPLDAPTLAAWLARRPVFASLARYEPFGLAVLEAAQAGCALVLSDIPTFRELWDGAALFLPCDATDTHVAESIGALLRDEERHAALRAAARERSRSYGVEAMTEGMLRVYAASRAGQGERAA